MNTKLIMIGTAVYLGIAGIGLTFLPEEFLSFFKVESQMIVVVILQILGGLYFGFAMMNWTAKHSLIGGIYNRPLVLGNLLHFLCGTFALIKVVEQFDGLQFYILISIVVVYAFFALCFGFLLKNLPNTSQKKD